MVRCSNQDCPLSVRYHISCVGLKTIPSMADDWWCCQDCADSLVSVFCKCNTIRSGPTVMCAAGEKCERGLKFHLQCIDLTSVPGMLICGLVITLNGYLIYLGHWCTGIFPILICVFSGSWKYWVIKCT